jgi:hypothetical protein
MRQKTAALQKAMKEGSARFPREPEVVRYAE